MEALGGEEVWLLLIHDLGTSMVCSMTALHCVLSNAPTERHGCVLSTPTSYSLTNDKAVPLHATKALGGERRYSSYLFRPQH
jgi:hypothetical protein